MSMILSNNSRPTSPLDFNSCIEEGDYVAALAILDANHVGDQFSSLENALWTGYVLNRLGGIVNYNRAKDIYLNILLSDDFQANDTPKDVSLFLSIVYINLHQYKDAEETALSVVDDESSELRTRILLTIAKKTNDESKISNYRLALSNTSKEDKMAVAAVAFGFHHKYQDVINTYKDILAGGNVDDLALYVYTAMALFKLGKYEEALDALDIFCQVNPDSIIAANIKACCLFNLGSPEAALEVLNSHCDSRTMEENDLVRHNQVVFQEGERALQVLPKLVNHIPEARLNLAIYYLKQGELDAAVELIGDLQADSPHSHLVLGILNTELAKVNGSDSTVLAKAKHHFQSFGQSSTTETIATRQAMSEYYYLSKQFDDANLYFGSIEEYMNDNDEFHYNYGISLAASGKFKEVSSRV